MEENKQTHALEKTTEREAFSGEMRKTNRHPTNLKDLLKMYLYRLYHTKLVFIVYGIVAFVAIIALAIMAEGNAQTAKAAQASGGTYTPQFSISMIALWCFGMPSLSSTSLSASNLNQAISTMLFSYIPLGFFGLFVVAFFIGKDWQNRTFRNQILAGHSRLMIFLCAQIVAAIIALGLVVTWQVTIWGIGSILRIPVFLENQFNATLTGGTLLSPNMPKLFALCFFMDLLIYLSLTVLSCSWAFIIPNSWGALGLIYASMEAASILCLVIFGLGYINANSYYQVQEFLFPYQLSCFNSIAPEIYVTYKANSYGGIDVVYNGGRTLVLCLKTLASSLIIIGGMGCWGAHAFIKRDLK